MMHAVNPVSGRRRLYGNGRWSALVLTVFLAACQAPSSEAVTLGGPVAANQPAAPAAPAPAPPTVTPPAAQAPSTAADVAADDDMPPRRPDDSYRKAKLRPQYIACVNASDAVVPALQACGDAEFIWQRERMRTAFAAIADGPDGKFKDDVMDEQDAYMNDTDRYCRFDPENDGQGQMLDAQSCRINRFANRADALQALISK